VNRGLLYSPVDDALERINKWKHWLGHLALTDATDQSAEALGVMAWLAGAFVVAAAGALAIHAADYHDGELWFALRAGITPATFGLLIIAVARRLRPGTDEQTPLSPTLWLASGLTVLIYAALIVKDSTEPGSDQFWAPIVTFTMLEPASLSILLYLTASASSDTRLLGAPSKFGRGVALSAIVGSVAFGVKSVTDSDFQDSAFWTFLALTSAPCAAGFLLLGASRESGTRMQPPMDSLALVGGLLTASAGLAYAIKLASESPVMEFWIFLYIAIVPFGLGVLAALASRENSSKPLIQVCGVLIVLAAAATAIKVTAASPVETFVFNILGLATRLFGVESISILSAGDDDVWLLLATFLMPAAIGTLIFLVSKEAPGRGLMKG
jgi:hypothetical protein